MKKIFSILLISSFLLQCSGYLIVYADFVANRDYIAKNLCVNRAHPEMKCNGKCQLCKRLKAETQKENKGLPAVRSLKMFVLFSSPKNIFHYHASNDAVSYISFYLNDYSNTYKQGIFHPPLG